MAEEWSGEMAFKDVGAVVYWLKAVPWTIPGFSVEKHSDILFAMQEKIDKDGKIGFTEKKFLLKAKKV